MLEQTTETMMASLSHEFKMPLAVTLSSLQLLQSKMETRNPEEYEKEYHQYFDIAVRNVYRTLRMTNNLIDTTRLSDNKIHPIVVLNDLKELMSEIIENAQSYAQCYARTKNVKIEFTSLNPSVEVMCDARLIERCVLNLLTNALKAVPRESGFVKIKLWKDETHVVLEVTDNGCGISEEEIPHLFEKFWRARVSDGDKNGVGLGLFIVKSIVELHGGEITVKSQKGQGSTFSMRLPVLPSTPLRENMAKESAVEYRSDWQALQMQVEMADLLS